MYTYIEPMSEQIPFDNSGVKEEDKEEVKEDNVTVKDKNKVKCGNCPTEFLPSDNFKGRTHLCGPCRQKKPEATDAKPMVQFPIPMDIRIPKYHPPPPLFQMAEYFPTPQFGLGFSHPNPNLNVNPTNCIICSNKVDIYLIPDNLAFCKSCYDAQGRIREYSPPVHQQPKVCECFQPKVCECFHPKVLEIFKDGEPTFYCGDCNKPL